jgi:hypothetical protein
LVSYSFLSRPCLLASCGGCVMVVVDATTNLRLVAGLIARLSSLGVRKVRSV